MGRKLSNLNVLILGVLVLVSVGCVEFKAQHTLSSCHLTKTDSMPTEPQPMTIQLINTLMQSRKIANNNQYTNCFSQEQLITLDNRIQQGLDLGRVLNENSIENYPKLVTEYLRKTFSKEELQCFGNSNDLKMLMLSYNIQSVEQAIQAFK